MLRNKKTLRLTMLGLLCGGLLLIGIGAGVAFAEYSSFTYAGQRVPEQAQAQTQSFTAKVDQGAEQIVISGNSSGIYPLEETARIEVSEDLEPGTVQLDLQYQSIGPKIRASWDQSDPASMIRLYWTGGDDIALLMSYKDQILEDIRGRQVGDYVAALLTEAVITVNPADEAKIVLN